VPEEQILGVARSEGKGSTLTFLGLGNSGKGRSTSGLARGEIPNLFPRQVLKGKCVWKRLWVANSR
jgi:hypothetical protein